MIIPIAQHKAGVLEKAAELRDRLSKVALYEGTVRVKMDDSEKSTGWKFSEQEMRGIPVRIEIGPKDIEANKCVVARRDTGEKIDVCLDELDSKIVEILTSVQDDMFARAKKHLTEHTCSATNFDEFTRNLDEKPGFIKAMWCGDQACEDEIKEKTGATSRCMPFEQEQVSDYCICCGKPAKKMVYWGRSY